MGSRSGAEATAARRIGVTVEEYRQRVGSGEKWCGRCRSWHPVEAFGRDSTRGDGRSPSCRDSMRQRQREAYTPRPRQRGRRYADARDGDREQARGRVNHLVRVGLLPDPNAVPCTDCEHLGPERRHEYDHHLGYAPEHHEDVEPVCAPCHNDRTVQRGEMPVRLRDERGRYAPREVMGDG